ncbi:unnamed protein product [Peronospora destructor]|nr:unnamed protein product [Peronospora destructor]
MAKSFAVQCLVDRQIDAASQLLHHLLSAEDESLLRDRVFLHAVTEVVLEQVKLAAASTSSSNGNSNDVGATSAENGEVTMTLSEQLQTLEVWKQIVDGFFVGVLVKRIQAAKEETGFLVHFVEGAVERVEDEHDTAATDETSSKKRKRQRVVQSFPTPAFHEKTVMMLSSLFVTVEKGGSAAGGTAMIASYIKKTLGVLRSSCFSLEEFEALWSSPVFAGCRHFYEPMLTKLPDIREELFAILSSDVKTEDKIATEAADVHKVNVDSATVDSTTQGANQKLEGTYAEGDTATKSEGDAATKLEVDAASNLEVDAATKSGGKLRTLNQRLQITVDVVSKQMLNEVWKERSTVIAFNVENPETDAESIAEPNSSGNDMDVKMEEVEEVSELKDSTTAAGSEPYASVSADTPSAIAKTAETRNEFAVLAGKAVNADDDEESIVGSSDTQKVMGVEPTVEEWREETRVAVQEKNEAAET